ncbi:2-hydroxycarboxylate transporter family protein [Phenylobacterium montanum]|uniref:2-hydroxycarboxylate transporter family protein n=1 Tax=Phenylobacterium montanum TaxID=2823693 RepID=A0A975IWH5_9CAUL|nr:2-hydroxycarboxylate transporter family protein [Caulobacter sp. S6]QUD89594.1 2-hydroxycarboxylate transporter family protein [Caulobacter sp. S6]
MNDQTFNVRAGRGLAKSAWPYGWWRIVDARIGIVPVPVFVLLLALIWAFVATGKPPSDVMMNIGVLSVGGFACAELGKRLPFLGEMGAGAIFATFAPSYLVYAHLLPKGLVTSVTDFTKQSNILYLFIASIIVGSILSMDRRVLIAGFLKIFAPIAAGSVAALGVGSAVGYALGLGLRHTLYYIVVPVMAGGVGEGAIPLSIGYGAILHKPQGELFAQVLPAVMMGSLTAILLSGALNLLGHRLPGLTGEGRLQSGPGAHTVVDDEDAPHGAPSVASVAAAGVTAVALYLVGVMTQRLWNWPAPVTMLFLAVLLKLGRAVSPDLRGGAMVVYRFFSVAVTYPLLFAIGVAMTPWDKLIAGFNRAEMATVVAVVVTMVGTGFATAYLVRLHPIDTAIVAACRCGQGGTGDVAILTAANRMKLMPFAQIATRIGGALTVTLALIALARFGG